MALRFGGPRWWSCHFLSTVPDRDSHRADRLPLETRILLRADLQVGCSGLWCGKIRKRCLRPG